MTSSDMFLYNDKSSRSSWSQFHFKSLNPNAEEFVPFVLRPASGTEKKLQGKQFQSPGTAGKNIGFEKEAVPMSSSAAEGSCQDLCNILPEDITIDFTDMVGQDLQSTAPNFSGNEGMNKVRVGYSSIPALVESLPNAYCSRDNRLTLGETEDLFVGDLLTHPREELFSSKEAVDPLEFLSLRFPQFPTEQLLEMHLSNGCDLNSTIDQLARFEFQSGVFSRNMNLRWSSSPQPMQPRNGPNSDYGGANFIKRGPSSVFLPSSPKSMPYTHDSAPYGFAVAARDYVPPIIPQPALSSSFWHGIRDLTGETCPGRSENAGKFPHLYNRACLQQFHAPRPSKFRREPVVAEQNLHLSGHW
ncbi:polyadenylate-binding protein-interacting protein 7-like [Wolffia australiana]